MAEEEKILNDLNETEESGFLETYVRFNDDLEKDYCFQVKNSSVFKDLYKIFKTLPISLRPNMFYNSLPIGFTVSTAPGYLTDDGALLFSYETSDEKYLKKVSINDKISDNIWPGQLIIPIWEFNSFGFYSFLTFLLVWLYTDLPDFISPTPGLCLTNQVSKLAAYLVTNLGYEKLAKTLTDDIQAPVSNLAQIGFFIFHIIKVSVIFLFIHTGAFNPIKLFRWKRSDVPQTITKEGLISIGWTGVRRACPDEYKDFYRDYKIKEYGGMVPAHQAGLFDKLKNLGVFLGDGEGFNTPLDNKSTLKDLLPPPEEQDVEEKPGMRDDSKLIKFTLNYEYFAQLGEFFQRYTAQEDSNLVEAIKQFRRYGILHSPEVVQKIVTNRKKFGDAKL